MYDYSLSDVSKHADLVRERFQRLDEAHVLPKKQKGIFLRDVARWEFKRIATRFNEAAKTVGFKKGKQKYLEMLRFAEAHDGLERLDFVCGDEHEYKHNVNMKSLRAQGTEKRMPGYLLWMWTYQKARAEMLYVELGFLDQSAIANDALRRQLITPPKEIRDLQIKDMEALRAVAEREAVLNFPAKPALAVSDKHKYLEGEFSDLIADHVVDHERHDIEDDFDAFITKETSGHWLLSGGPGLGKSAIIANIAHTHRDTAEVFSYFFRQDFAGDARENSAANCIAHLICAIEAQYQIAAPEHLDKTSVDALDVLLWTLAEHSAVSCASPLLILIDALDEMVLTGEESQRHNPMGLPVRLPEGVFIAQSTRFEMSPPKGFRHASLSSGENVQRHKNTARRYAQRICSIKEYVEPFHRANGKREQAAFVSDLCDAAGDNFMILRSCLHDEEYWSGGGTGINLGGDLKGYYEQQLRRMRARPNAALHQDAALCFALKSEISAAGFARLLGGRSSPNVAQGAKALRENWIAQGLLHKHNRDGADWLRAFHRTYRDFLNVELGKTDASDALLPFIEGLCDGIDLSGDFSELLDESASYPDDWVELVLTLSVRAQHVQTLGALLMNVNFWALARLCRPRETHIILSRVSRLPTSLKTDGNLRTVMRAVARKLVNEVSLDAQNRLGFGTGHEGVSNLLTQASAYSGSSGASERIIFGEILSSIILEDEDVGE